MKTQPNAGRSVARLWGIAVVTTLALAACGGGNEGSEPKGVSAPVSGEAIMARSAAQTITLQQQGARLNNEELEQIAKTGVLPEPFEGPLLSGAEGSTGATLNSEAVNKSLAARKSAASLVPVYRFFNGSTSAHFFTTSTTERDNVIANQPAFSYEGPAFNTSNAAIPGLSPVHRFYNTQTGVHFYTISETERANVAANLPQFNYEGIAYYASTLSGTGYVPLYRFFHAARGFHFYTNGQVERDIIIATLPEYSYEGIGYYVLNDDWQTPAVPHTGIGGAQCYKSGSNTLFFCGFQSTRDLNSQQDGHRISVNRMSYSEVTGQSGAECMRDNVTGLVWEVKTAAAGPRAGSRTYRRTLGFVGDPTTTAAYVDTVNNLNLCGFNDWRLPTMEELHGLVDFGRSSGPRISLAAFPNTQEALYWTSTDSAADGDSAWYVRFDGGASSTGAKSSLRPVRLVRGGTWTGQRYVVTTQAYPGDTANNAVIDRKTGLTWRRCLEGQSWGGASCSGVLIRFTHEEALAYASGPWRLPNAKELASLADRSLSAPSLGAVAFPAASDVYTWSTTPTADATLNAWLNNFSIGSSFNLGRTTNDVGLRLVYTLE
ncbi:hypothetical protein LPB72_21120 [Hydrogenophaga crassostreae]|uniref:DUF1566 domain-containing protein n=1 Tax=Hydrogenophaga crassostreae TaxID=1763535 RepID=A0A162YQP8_9BURK|nr:DUF1566 domain-containing protein [Hydrogenophaga crassostreae]AOW15038.1 hypothetical protein LPB072_21735 [Hydrogenophaga crassostreae]OAD39490.1 hypothetical protein LPB72_21120 [Hydrogenophaga crassostreae]